MSSDDMKRRTELQKGLESFSVTHNGFPGEYELGEEDAKFFAQFKVCFDWAIDGKEDNECEDRREAYWWTKDLLNGEVETLHDLWKEKVEKRGNIGDKEGGQMEMLKNFWTGKVEELSKMSNKKLKKGIRELKRRN